jgi:Fe-S-cluster containining protein
VSDPLSTHAQDDAFAATMREFYDDVDAAVASRRAVCINRGVCCQFGRYGHRLFVTDAELAFFIRGLRGQWRRPADDADICPYQVEGRCTAREHRPLGCRIYYCDPSAQAWQGAEYERFLSKLKAIGERFGVDYRYREWLSALREVEIDATDSSNSAVSAPRSVDGLCLPVIK